MIENAESDTMMEFVEAVSRGVMGSYHYVSRKYLPLYLAECQFRFNNRQSEDMFGEIIAGC